MSPNAAALRAPRFAALSLDLVRAVVPVRRVLDTLFPTAPFLLCSEGAELCHFPENVPEQAVDFYARFRQAGGARSVASFTDTLPRTLAAADGGTLLVVLHEANGLAAVEVLEISAARPPLLLLAPEEFHPSLSALRALGYQGCCFVRLIQNDLAESFCLLSTEHDTAWLLKAFEAAGKKVAVDMWLDTLGSAAAPSTVVVVLPEDYQNWSDVSLSPFELVHDGSRTPEGDASYGWMWFDQAQLRMLLGPVANRFRRVRVIVPNALTTDNLRRARLILNGDVVRPHVEVWSERGGAVSIELPLTLAEPLVLGLWLPEGQMTEEGTTKLYACIDRVELSA